MNSAAACGNQIQGQILETIRKSQDAVTDALSTWSEAVRAVTPSLPVPSLPLADKLPKPGDLLASAYDFAEQLLASQRKFAEDVLQATAPSLAATGESGSTTTE
jgi:hypothetical protein